MGLTIHYSLTADLSDDGARAAIRALHARARRLRFAGIEDVTEFRAPDLHVTRETLASDPEL
ncbi:MAG: hypothetical protein ABIP55_00610 [Tepidisphaeraceae bacterium]